MIIHEAIMEIKKLKVKDLKYAPYNPRKMSDEMLEKLKRSIKEFGYVEPIIVNQRNMQVVGGNQRLKVLEDLEIEEVEAVIVDLDDAKEKTLNIALNSIIGEWDYPKLKDLFEELDTGEIDIELTGFDMGEIEDLMNQTYIEGRSDDKIPEPPKEPECKLGNLYKLGKHRLLCGDATIKDNLNRLVDGNNIDLIFTDPPYNIGYDYWDFIDNKKLIDYKNWCEEWFNLIIKLAPITLITIGQWNLKMWLDIAEPLGMINWIARNKTSGSKISLFSVWEPILVYAKKINKKKRNKADYIEGLIIREDDEFVKDVNEAIEYVRQNCDLIEINNKRQKDIGIHSCPKQVKLITELLLRYSDKNNAILDIFGGSGTTLIACEKINRICYMMEIEPVYCDVIIKRWEDYTGQKAVKVNG